MLTDCFSFSAACFVALAGLAYGANMPENLALRATASATSEHNQHYLAKFAADGKIPAEASHSADLDAAWCVLKAKTGDSADYTLKWNEPIETAEIIYWGRTAWFINECWKDFEVLADGSSKPIARGSLKAVHGPQRIAFPKTRLSTLTIRFLNSHGGPNPGAAEIQVFAASPSDAQLAEIAKRQTVGKRQTRERQPEKPLAVRPADFESLAKLIDSLSAAHGDHYAKAAAHHGRLETLKVQTPADRQRDLEALQREVLLFDVDRVLAIRRHEILASHVYTYHYEGFRPGGGLFLISAQDPSAEPRLLVESPTGQILDCDLSHDGRTALFSWRRNQDEGYHLWTVNVDGEPKPKRLTDGQWHDYNACWLPDGGIAFLSTRWPQFAYCWHAPVGVLCRMNADGSGFQRLSANYLNDFTPAVLDNGRIIYSRWEYVDRPAIPIQSLWTINPDGTGLSGYFGNRVISPATFMEARSIPGTQKILCTMTGHNGPARGAIGMIDRSRGDNVQEAIENLTPDVAVPKVNQGCGNFDGEKFYSCPMPLDGSRFLVSARGPILVRTLTGECQSILMPAPKNGQQWFSAQPVRKREKPPVVGSALPEKPEPHATVFLQDVYNGLEPHVARGEVKAIRVVREMSKGVRIDPKFRAFDFQFPVISCGATYAAKDVLGEVPVEDDGSACFRVPTGIPIYFMALDADGRAVQRMRTFTHFMPGEVQGCIGCHESRLHGSAPTAFIACNRPPRELISPEWGRGGFDYSRIVQPVLDQHCVKCHDSIDPPNRLDLTGGKTDFFNVSYDCLARENWGRTGSPYVKWIPTNNGHEWNILEITPKFWGSPASKLAEVIATGHPDRDGEPRVSLDSIARRRVYAWIDLNVPYYGTSETAYPDRPGCRQILPDDLKDVLADVGRRRCAECHPAGNFPNRAWTRITEPERNPFLMAPLAKSAGGSEKCKKAVFADRNDPDYQRILITFDPTTAMLKQRPRMDMPGAKPAEDVCRICQ